MATITKTMKQDAIDTAVGMITKIRHARCQTDADIALGGALAIANYAQVWSLITPEDATHVRHMAGAAHRKWCDSQKIGGAK